MKASIKTTYKITYVSILSSIAFLIMLLEFNIPFFPPFLRLDLSEVPGIIGGLIMGPKIGVLIVFIKNLIHLVISKNFGIGELANFVIGGSLVFSLTYTYSKTKKPIISILFSIIIMALTSVLVNLFIIFPLYSKILGLTVDKILALASKFNSNVDNIKTYFIYVIAPFNLIKGFIVSLISLSIYKRL